MQFGTMVALTSDFMEYDHDKTITKPSGFSEKVMEINKKFDTKFLAAH